MQQLIEVENVPSEYGNGDDVQRDTFGKEDNFRKMVRLRRTIVVVFVININGYRVRSARCQEKESENNLYPQEEIYLWKDANVYSRSLATHTFRIRQLQNQRKQLVHPSSAVRSITPSRKTRRE